MNINRDLSHWLLGRPDLLLSNPVLWIQRIASSLAWDVVNVSKSIQVLTNIVNSKIVRDASLPGWYLEELSSRGLITHIESERPESSRNGIIGLVADESDGLVVPIEVSLAPTWSIPTHFPFREPQLLRVISALASLADIPGLLPERYAFKISSPLQSVSEGRSMDLAAAIAILDCLRNHHEKSSAKPASANNLCCVVAKLGEGDSIEPVGHVKQKLDAFTREFRCGTLLIRASSCDESMPYLDAFQNVWTVGNLFDLTSDLKRSRWLDSITRDVPLSSLELERLLRTIEHLLFVDHSYRDAAHLAERSQSYKLGDDVPFEARQRLDHLACDTNRHLGKATEAADFAKSMCKRARETGSNETGFGASHNEIAKCDVLHAASLFDFHEFQKINEILDPWIRRVENDPLVVEPQTRVMLWNTVARTLIAQGASGWLQLLQLSHESQKRFAPSDLSRTENYLIYGHLRSGDYENALSMCGRDESLTQLASMSKWMRSYLKADIARRTAELWEAPWMESGDPIPNGCGHPFAFYFVSTARHQGRSIEDRSRRFQMALQILDKDILAADGRTVEQIYRGWVHLAASHAIGDRQAIEVTLDEMASLVEEFPNVPLRSFCQSLLESARDPVTRSDAIDEALDHLLPL